MEKLSQYQSALKAVDVMREKVAKAAANLKAAGERPITNPIGMMATDDSGRFDSFRGDSLSTLSTSDVEALLKEYFGAIATCRKLFKGFSDSERGAVVPPPVK